MRNSALLVLPLLAACAAAPHHDPAHAGADERTAVDFPAAMKDHTLANMRDHLATLQAIQAALAEGRYEAAANLAETRLGLTSLEAHGAHDLAHYMPAGMQELGTGMHRAASRFALVAAEAGATGDARPAIGALASVTSQCVACHAAYRLR